MATLTLIAEFPLGVFQGKQGDGATRDPLPDPARLHAALLHSAGKGSAAIIKGGDLRPSDESLNALRWLEEHPPTALAIPEHIATHPAQELAAFRNEGTLAPKQKGIKILRKSLKCRTALASPVAWTWDNVPSAVKQRIELLAADVACLGEADSPVIISSGAMVPTHFWDPDATVFSSRPLARHRCPAPGRVEALEREYERIHPPKLPRPAKATSDEGTSSPGEAGGVEYRHYRPVEAPPIKAPWTHVWVFPTSQIIPENERVSAAVAFHRTIAARIGDDAPASITGAYAPRTRQPANRVAIHVLDHTHGKHLGMDRDAFLVLVPADMPADDLQRLESATSGRLEVRTARWRARCHRSLIVAGDSFWQPPAGGLRRLWKPAPAMVSETRRQRPREAETWTLGHAALLSLAFVFRDSLPEPQGDRYWGRLDDVRAHGARVDALTPVVDTHVERYVYKHPRDLVVQPFSAILDLGRLAEPTTLVALGQARHMGGGLLVPVDVEEQHHAERQ